MRTATTSIQVICPAKINLSLGITGIRQDGYHTLCSVMQSIGVFNEVCISIGAGGGITLTSDDPHLPTDAANTAYRAALYFREEFGIKDGFLIHIVKRVPYQAGLGSASADAAGVLYALSRLYGIDPYSPQIKELAVRVGADVVFCLMGGTMLAEGIGELLQPLPPMPPCGILVIKPREGASTPAIFKAYDQLDPEPCQPDTDGLIKGLAAGSLSQLAACLGNVLECCVPAKSITEIKQAMLQTGCLGTAMTGSGSAVFGIYHSIEDAKKAALVFDTESCWVKVCAPYAGGVTEATM